MARRRDDDDFDTESRGSWIRNGTVIVVGLVIGGLAWHFLSDKSGMRREAPRVTTLVALLPPPPPPPPPPKARPPEQKPLEQPKQETPQTDAPRPMTMNADAQAGGDAFNIGAGDGSGQLGSGSGLGDATYTRYMQSAIQDAIQRDDRVARLAFTAELIIWVDERGRLTKARILRTAGDPRIDEALLSDTEGLVFEQAPPSTLRFPQRIRMSGRRPA